MEIARLGFPAGRTPGFNPSHPASGGISAGRGFSGVASGGSFRSLITGKVGTLNNTPTGGIKANLGPIVNFTASADGLKFAGQSTANDSDFTIGAILSFNTLGSLSCVFGTSATGDSLMLHKSAANVLAIRTGGGNQPSDAPALVASVPYFVAVSVTGTGAGTAKYVQTNLSTGVVQTGTGQSAARTPGSDGTYVVGNWAFFSLPTLGNIAAIMYAPSFISSQQLMQWAQNPWSFWYPDK